MPRHDWGEHAPVGALARLQGGDDLRDRPVAEPGGLVGCQVGADEGAKPRHLEADVGAAKEPRLIRLAEEVSRRVAVVAAGDRDQVLAARELLVGGRGLRLGGRDGGHDSERRERGGGAKRQTHVTSLATTNHWGDCSALPLRSAADALCRSFASLWKPYPRGPWNTWPR